MTRVSHTPCKKCRKNAHVAEMLKLPDAGHECSDRAVL